MTNEHEGKSQFKFGFADGIKLYKVNRMETMELEEISVEGINYLEGANQT